ncbi:peptidoglycan DD-metalloendopeptidase family protein [Streptomyces sp. NPDC005322]|uniref:peptidoglycan DD-metalloendopeptidase family protein n=1 Tax=Streptomyces sp. NPDC005322 TaxID=3157032 RepID=UPI0033A4F87A
MVAPAVLAAAKAASKTAKAAKAAAQLAGGQGDGGGGKKKGGGPLKFLVGGGGCMTLGMLVFFLVMILMASFIGGMGGGAAGAACSDYDDTADSGNSGDAAATNPIMPAGKMYMPSETARNEIPPKMILASMRAAAHYRGLDWTLIAGQMYQETKFGQDPSAAPGGHNSLGYAGILQFGKPAWHDYGADGNDDGQKDLYNIDDAAYGTANYLHAEHAETNPAEALRVYSGSTTSNTIYMRVVLTQAARYRGVLTGDKDLIKRWYAHLKKTIDKNPGFPTLGKQSDIPEPVNNNAQPTNALSISATPAKSWSTPPLDGGTPDTEQAAFHIPADGTGTGTGTDAAGPAIAPAAFSRPLAKPAPDPSGQTGGKDWQMPLKKGTYQIGTRYKERGNMWSLGYHTGLDLVAPAGTPIYAPADGTVTKAGPGGSYGNETEIRHKGGTVTLYAHQTKIMVSAGQSVKRGDQIGTVGATGNVTGPHLHWEVRLPGVDNPFVAGQDQGPGMVDPEDWMKGKVTAKPDYGTIPGGDGKQTSKDDDFKGCANEHKGPAIAPDGVGATGVMPDADDPVIRAVLGWAQRGIGTPYVLGAPRLQGQNPTSFDCSSFTQWAYYMASNGKINIGSTTFDQEPHLKAHEVSLSQAQPGDVIFFNPSSRGSEHVGLVWDPKGHKIIHAPRPGTTVRFSTWDVQDKVTGVYRVPIPKGTNPVEGDGKSSDSTD